MQLIDLIILYLPHVLHLVWQDLCLICKKKFNTKTSVDNNNYDKIKQKQRIRDESIKEN